MSKPEQGCAGDGAGRTSATLSTVIATLSTFIATLSTFTAACEDFGIGYRILSIRLPAPMAIPQGAAGVFPIYSTKLPRP